MPKKQSNQKKLASTPWYHGADVPMSVIRRYARQVVEYFQPDKIILFGSYGRPHADSDVDILVVLPTGNQIDQAVQIDRKVDPPFARDLIVRRPTNMAWRLREGDSFLREIVSKGKVLYEKTHGRVGAKGRGRLTARRRATAPPRRSTDRFG
jgi:uncharacterized protein